MGIQARRRLARAGQLGRDGGSHGNPGDSRWRSRGHDRLDSARIPVAVEGLIPNWTAEMMGLLEYSLPAPTNLGAAAVQGRDINSPIAAFANRMVPERARP